MTKKLKGIKLTKKPVVSHNLKECCCLDCCWERENKKRKKVTKKPQRKK